jgi:PBSX family phage terminase large subunit
VETENDLLVQIATEGAKARYGSPLPANVQERLDYELGVITKTGYAGYFLITADFIKAARDRGIPVGPGRGSAAGSLVAYATRITDVCPLEFDLLFERFLNPERVSMPDVDVDFCFERRGEVIEYVRQKYGKDSVGQIVTFGTMKSRAAVKDVGRTLGFSPAETDALAKLIPNAPNNALTVAEAVTQVPEVKELYRDERYRQLLDFAIKLEGLSRHTGVHAAGVVIAPGPLDEFVPICTQASKGSGGDGDERVIVTQYDMTALEQAGMLKLDFLGLTTLTVITDTIKAIKERTGVEVTLEERGFTDEKTYQVLRAGRTGGVFQFESPLATDVLKRMRCDRFDDLVASNALLRPGPLDAGMHNVYIRRKRGEEPTVYALPELEPILSNTYGVITYQEQVMRIAQVLAGISLAEADVLRKAVGKKDAELIKKELGKFSEKAIAKGYDPTIIEELAGQIETFGRYGFNKCLVGDTEIYDAATGQLVRIADVYEQRARLHSVATCTVDTLRLGEGRVVDVMDNGIKPVFRVRTESGREITATGNHPFLMVDGWRSLEEIVVGEHVTVPRVLPASGPRAEWPAHEVIALGHLLAEGNLGHPTGVYYYNQDEASVADFIAAAECFANVKCTRTTHKNTASVYTGRVDRKRENGIFEWARALGLLGKIATNKEVPSAAFGLSNEQIGLLLGRMWDGDGHVNPSDRNTYYATSSKRLAQQVQHLLLRLGILWRIREVSFAFAGLRHNLDSIKSKSRILLNWTDEAENVSDAAWRKLIPTIREGGKGWVAENWISYNPESSESATHRRFVENPPDDCIVTTVNWQHNPWFPDVLNKQRLEDQRLRPETYDHIWDGAFLTLTDAQIFGGKFVVDEFEPLPTWDGPYYGLDFGFANDPTAAVEVWLQGKTLYIRREAGKTKLELDATGQFVSERIPGIERGTIRADSARPESISYLRRHGLPSIVAVEKWQGSVEDGIDHIKSYDRVVIHPDCQQTAREFRLYSYKVDRNTGDILRVVVDAHNHYIDALRYALGPMIQKRNSAKMRQTTVAGLW